MVKIDIEMPTYCYDCPCHNGENGRCNITGDSVFDKRPFDCPLQEVRHAHWIKNEAGYYECSNCGSTKPHDGTGGYKPEWLTYWECPYCRYCGAKMDGAEEGNV